mmetsp:Transcript_15699/g.42596  ORF Transcript_15699/g.42596 Transcript_15699/m.42596 type:complete len:201 (-) Transcript_15699:3809-4411(-)
MAANLCIPIGPFHDLHIDELEFTQALLCGLFVQLLDLLAQGLQVAGLRRRCRSSARSSRLTLAEHSMHVARHVQELQLTYSLCDVCQHHVTPFMIPLQQMYIFLELLDGMQNLHIPHRPLPYLLVQRLHHTAVHKHCISRAGQQPTSLLGATAEAHLQLSRLEPQLQLCVQQCSLPRVLQGLDLLHGLCRCFSCSCSSIF